MRRAIQEPGWSWTELRAAEVEMFSNIDSETSIVRLLAQLSDLLLNKRKGLVATQRQPPPPLRM